MSMHLAPREEMSCCVCPLLRCAYELYISLQESRKGFTWDVYTIMEDSQAGVGIIDGLAAIDKKPEDKRRREEKFPFKLVTNAIKRIELQTAKASVPTDRDRILNAIAGVLDLSATPPSQHENYDQINNILRGRFAAAFLRRAVQHGGKTLDLFLTSIGKAQSKHLSIDMTKVQQFSGTVMKMVVAKIIYNAIDG